MLSSSIVQPLRRRPGEAEGLSLTEAGPGPGSYDGKRARLLEGGSYGVRVRVQRGIYMR